ncbi:competence type IV pilus minor pilin ComGF [Domibacillus epiphyticus]|uniref:Competence protein ComGF n=1 Tax=Domibacillus epiphyticus TaxID=1714355 RepID=A0A1V2A9L6_9BACI|nr:competence type IV pilus minor pilin ComGF [Domibacillus epiphyticus]OMP67689.1 hypothetical protein BTO28_07035 [Domibacillus epiphyticus]
MFQSNRGFTLIEALIALIVFLACAASFPLLYDAAYRAIETSKAEKNMEWEIFVVQLRNEMQMSKNWHVSGGKLYYGEADALTSISQYQDKLRRQINGRGHEVMLQHIKTAVFSFEGGKLYIHATFQNGEEEEASFYHFNRETP